VLLECNSCWLTLIFIFLVAWIAVAILLNFLLRAPSAICLFISFAFALFVAAWHLCHEFCSSLQLLSVEYNTVVGLVVM